MFTSLALIKAFFSHWFGILITVIILCLLVFGVAEYFHIKDLNETIATQQTALGQAKAVSAQFESAASECSAGTAALAASETAANVASASAVAVAEVKAKTYEDHATAVLNEKPVGNDDYANSKKLMDDLIDHRTANQP